LLQLWRVAAWQAADRAGLTACARCATFCRTLLEIYGPDLHRWPMRSLVDEAAERAEAVQLVEDWLAKAAQR
jgi:hypothetical protein